MREPWWKWGSLRMAIRTYIWKKPAPPAIKIPKLPNKPMPAAVKIQKFPNKPIRLAIKFRKVRSRPRPARVRTKTNKQRPPQRTKSRPRKKKLRQINLTAITKNSVVALRSRMSHLRGESFEARAGRSELGVKSRERG